MSWSVYLWNDSIVTGAEQHNGSLRLVVVCCDQHFGDVWEGFEGAGLEVAAIPPLLFELQSTRG